MIYSYQFLRLADFASFPVPQHLMQGAMFLLLVQLTHCTKSSLPPKLLMLINMSEGFISRHKVMILIIAEVWQQYTRRYSDYVP